MHQLYLLLGGNLGDRVRNLEEAARGIEEGIGPISTASAIYETEAWGVTNQPPFLNQVLAVQTSLSPTEVLAQIHRLEKKLGRKRREKWHARTIDIDILFYGAEVVNTPFLKIPHPEIPNRRFTLVPLAEIAPLWVHPVLDKKVEDLLRQCDDPLVVQALQILTA